MNTRMTEASAAALVDAFAEHVARYCGGDTPLIQHFAAHIFEPEELARLNLFYDIGTAHHDDDAPVDRDANEADRVLLLTRLVACVCTATGQTLTGLTPLGRSFVRALRTAPIK